MLFTSFNGKNLHFYFVFINHKNSHEMIEQLTSTHAQVLLTNTKTVKTIATITYSDNHFRNASATTSREDFKIPLKDWEQ